jgi:hypothetical protein
MGARGQPGEDSKHPGDLGTLQHKVKEIIRAAGRPDGLSFTSTRHEGFIEAADADLSDAEISRRGGTTLRGCCHAMRSAP